MAAVLPFWNKVYSSSRFLEQSIWFSLFFFSFLSFTSLSRLSWVDVSEQQQELWLINYCMSGFTDRLQFSAFKQPGLRVGLSFLSKFIVTKLQGLKSLYFYGSKVFHNGLCGHLAFSYPINFIFSPANVRKDSSSRLIESLKCVLAMFTWQCFTKEISKQIYFMKPSDSSWK